MPTHYKKKLAIFTLGVLLAAIAILFAEWWVVKTTVSQSPAQVFAAIAAITAVAFGTVAGRAAKPWLRSDSDTE